MKWKSTRRLFLMNVAAAANLCCQGRSVGISDSKLLTQSLSDFFYVGTANSQGELRLFAEVTNEDLPEELQRGTWYGFLLPISKFTSNMPDAIVANLVRAGAIVTKAPRRPEDFLYPSIGNPLFRIEFKYKGSKGELINQLEPSISRNATLAHEWCSERYLVRFS